MFSPNLLSLDLDYWAPCGLLLSLRAIERNGGRGGLVYNDYGWVGETRDNDLNVEASSGLFLRYLNGSHVTDSEIIQSPVNSHLLLLFHNHPNLD